jgi:hypothetical protein
MKYIENSSLKGRTGENISIQYRQGGPHEEINPAALIKLGINRFEGKTAEEFRDIADLLTYLDKHMDAKELELETAWWNKIKGKTEEALAEIWTHNSPAVWDAINDRLEAGTDKHKDDDKSLPAAKKAFKGGKKNDK